ncbi:hypothetical protein [Anaeromicropila populeti]|uniref:Uncharacterized protein n=1 Tax=Anaeromicropila populeti TaxID=37658 RepID=A0A1I6KUR2_9FIRM|nr:hypothetical protein [Anaeromicropila populeti]SFR94768.1 hypothetical protein SAMN05661086_02735 [Anaeromicropila populeti]
MYPVSEAFMATIESNSRNFYWTGSITTKNHLTYNFTNQDIVKGSGYITRQCCGSTEIELGTVYASELGITLLSDIDRYTLDEAEVKLFFHLVLPDGSEETIPMGIFEVSEANRTIHCLELTAYDYMLRFEKDLNLNSSSGTAYNFLHAASTECKVELAQTKAEIDALPNGKETLGIYSDNDMTTYRDLLYYVAQVLGCFCLINREGKLELIQYGTSSVADIPNTQRFSSSYSDFVTRYTAVSSTNLMTEEAEYYALEVDDGLTMNLGTNPLLQFGLKTTRERIIRNILNCIAVVNYVPFDSSTIGNPAFDPGDILTFSGGHADATKISCITSLQYKINGKHTLKCVGKNPKLAAAKSKNDKNITGLLNQIESDKIVVYNFVNVSPFHIGSSPTEVLAITFTSKETTSAMFLAEILLEINADEIKKSISGTATYEEESTDEAGTATTEQVTKPVKYSFTDKGEPELTIIYKMNGDEVETFYPTKTCIDGKHIVTLFYPISQVIENCENTLSVFLKVSGGSCDIGESQIRATITGQGLVAGIGDWNGRISITESFERIPFVHTDFGFRELRDSVMATFPAKADTGIQQRISRIAFAGMQFGYARLNERISVIEVIQTFTMDAKFPGEYDQTIIELNDADAFCLISDYTAVSTAEEINAGQLQHLAINTDPYERVENLEVKLC